MPEDRNSGRVFDGIIRKKQKQRIKEKKERNTGRIVINLQRVRKTSTASRGCGLPVLFCSENNRKGE